MDAIEDLDNITELLQGPNPRVYIGCSLTSEDQSGSRAEVLGIAHELFAAKGFEVYNPSQFTNPGSPHRPPEVYAIDYLNVVDCDLVFFIRSQPSLGLGMEAQIGSDLLIAWGDAKATSTFNKITPLLSGLANPKAGAHFNFDPNAPEEFRSRLENVLTTEMRDEVLRIKNGLRPTRQAIKKLNLGLSFRAHRLLKNISANDLGIRLGINSSWILSLEEADELFGGVSVGQLHTLMFELGLKFYSGDSDGCQLPEIVPSAPVEQDHLELAFEFARYTVRSRRPGEPSRRSDEEMMAHWREYATERGVALKNNSGDSLPGSGNEKPIKISISMPMSCLDKAEQKSLVCDTTKAIKEKLECRFDPNVVEVEIPEIWREPGQAPRQHNGGKVYADTISRLSDCDLGILFTFPPATGVGLCGQVHANLGIPTIIVSPSENEVSRMLTGAPFRQLIPPIKDTDSGSICNHVIRAVEENLAQLQLNSRRNHAHRRSIGSLGFETAICRQRVISGMSELDVLNSIKEVQYIRKEWIEYFIETPEKIQHMSLIQFLNISDKMGWAISARSGHLEWCPQNFSSDLNLSTSQQAAACSSLASLLDAKKRIQTKDRKSGKMFTIQIEDLVTAWSGYIDELTLDAADYQRKPLGRTVDQWMRVLTCENDL